MDKILKLKEDILSNDKFEFPAFNLDRFINPIDEFPYYFESRIVNNFIDDVDIELIYGSNWCFQSESTRGNYPQFSKVLSLLDGYIDLFKENKPITPIPVIKIYDKYIMEEGNHRLYVLKLLNYLGLVNCKKISCNVVEYDYDGFLKQCKIVRNNSSKQSNKLLYKRKDSFHGEHLYQVAFLTEKEVVRLEELKKTYK